MEPPIAQRRVTLVENRRQNSDVTQAVLASLLRSEAIGREVVFAGVADPRVPRKQGTEEQMKMELHRYIRDAHRHTIADLRRPRTCVLCKMQYRERENIGQWQCSYHPGRMGLACSRPSDGYLNGTLFQVWSCCGKDNWARGCTRCDHADEQFGPSICILATVPQFLLALKSEQPKDAALCVVAPRPVTIVDGPSSAWICPDIRNERDIRNELEERHYREEMIGPSAPPVYVMRMDYWGREPKITDFY